VVIKKDLILFFLFFCLFVQSQNRYNVDSLNQVLKTTSNDTVKIKTLQWIFDNYLYEKPDSAKIAFETMLSISRDKNFDWGHYQTYLYKSTYYWTVSKLDSVLASLNQSLKYAHILKDDTKISYCYTRLAMAQSSLGNYAEAKKLTFKALDIAKKNNDWEGLYYSYYRLGNTFYYENNFNKALINYLKVDSIFQHHERKEPALAASLSNIGSIYMEFKNFEKAITYFNESKKLYRDMKREEGQVYIDFNLGKVEFNKENYNEATKIMLPALEYYTQAGSKAYMADISGWLGASFLKTKDIEKAEKNYRNSAKWSIEAQNKILEANAYIGLAEVNQINKKADETIENLNKAQFIYDEMGVSYNGEQILKNLATAYYSKRDYKQAYDFSQRYQILLDSLTKKENTQNFQELETKYQTEKKEQEITLLKSQNELVGEQKRNQRNLLLGGIGLTTIAGLFFFFLYRNRQKTTKKLQELDKAKSNFFANISHEFRTPLTLISAPLEKRLETSKLSNDDRSDFEMMHRNSDRLLNLVDQLLDLSKLESGNLKLKVRQGNLSLLLRSLTSSFNHLAKQKEFNYLVDIEQVGQIWFDKDIIEKTVINLLSNAFKYTPVKGSINFQSIIKNNQLQLVIENSGTSLSKEKIEQIFNRFYQADENSEGVGIGLSLVKELITLSHGYIEVKNTDHGAIAFILTLPILESEFDRDELIYEKGTDTISKENKQPLPTFTNKDVEQNLLIDEDQPILLVVEDNADVREFVSKSFSKTYQIIQAENGKSGIEKAIEYVPDIIISDIMMPKTNGIELCDTLKRDERTSHIPIILLTAKIGEDDKYKGLETGADDYITKPFKIKLLETRVKNLVASRILLRNRYSQEVILKPKDIAITNFDEKFLEKIQSVLDEKLTESNFSSEEFSKALGISRMQLHRKLKALTGLTASEFVRSQRLKLAASLLQKSDANISEIGYMVGFNDHAYFSKCFKETYGCSPTEYGAK